MKFYLDTSAWVKRYLPEKGSPELDLVFEKVASGLHKLASSFWNIGECLGVFERRRQRGELSRREFDLIVHDFSSETMDMVRRGDFFLAPVSAKILGMCWKIVLEEHLYQADALQLVSSEAENCDLLLTGDEKILRSAEKVGIKAVSVEEREGQVKLREALKS